MSAQVDFFKLIGFPELMECFKYSHEREQLMFLRPILHEMCSEYIKIVKDLDQCTIHDVYRVKDTYHPTINSYTDNDTCDLNFREKWLSYRDKCQKARVRLMGEAHNVDMNRHEVEEFLG
jgi:hypothetical protein